MRDRIPWEQYGYRFVGEAADGEMALPLIRKTRPDVLITDIKMPFMDGLALSRIVREEFPKTKILIVSGYDDFEYAQQAIAIGIDQYILKPVTRSALRNVLQELRGKIEQEHEQESYQSKLANEMHEYEQFSKRHFFEKVLEGEMSATEIYAQAAKKSIDLAASSYRLLFLIMQEKKNADSFLRLQDEILHYFLRHPQYILFRWSMNSYGVLIKCEDDEIERYTSDAVEYVKNVYNKAEDVIEGYISYSKVVKRLSMLSDCYKEIRYYSAYRFIHPKLRLLTEESLKAYMPSNDDNQIVDVDSDKVSQITIFEFLSKGNIKDIHNFVEFYLQGITEALCSNMFRDYVILNIRFSILSFIESQGSTKEEYLDRLGKYAKDIHIQANEVFEYFVDSLYAAMEIRDEKNSSQNSKKLKQSLDYINEHFTDEDISLGTVASSLNISANYLSSAFSQNMQKTFTEYITEKRMEMAKKLLRSSNMATADIAYNIGYKDSHYFSFVFKKTVGVSPREYRNGKELQAI